jgi:hypothetical protein
VRACLTFCPSRSDARGTGAALRARLPRIMRRKRALMTLHRVIDGLASLLAVALMAFFLLIILLGTVPDSIIRFLRAL